jgi:colicin import membrane protein
MHPKFTLAILIIGISAVAKAQTSRPDSAKTAGKETLTTYQQGHVYDIMLVNDKIIGLEVDNKRIEAADFHRYDSVIRAIKADMKEDNDREQEDRAQEKRDWEQAQRDQEQAQRDREQAVKDRAQGEQDRKQAERDQEQAVKDREQARQDQQQSVQDREQGDRDREQGEHDRKEGERDRKEGERDREQGDRDREQGQRDREQGQRDREQGERDRKEAELERRMMRELLDDLVTEKIAPDVKSIYSVILTDSELVVNDKKQSLQLQQKIKDKYGKWTKRGISYGCCQEAPGTTIHFSN